MRKYRAEEVAPRSPVTKIYRCCDKHNISPLGSRDAAASLHASTEGDDYPRNDGGRNVKKSRNRALAGPAEDVDEALVKATAIIRKFQQRMDLTMLDSPTSCLKNSGRKKRPGLEKKVNFEDRCNDEAISIEGRSLAEESDGWWASNSSSYYQPRRCEIFKRGPSPRDWLAYDETSGSNNDSRRTGYSSRREIRPRQLRESQSRNDADFDASASPANSSRPGQPEKTAIIQKRVGDNGDFGGTSETSTRRGTMPSMERRGNASDTKSHASSRETTSRRSRGSPDSRGQATDATSRASFEESRLLEELSRVSLGSSTCCPDRKPGEESRSQPRIVKPRDGRRRAALRRMLVYPPEGQRGEPLTLRKKWSNIDCHVEGDPAHGFKYKVYYMQKFVSDKWFPDVKTGGPFRSIEDANCSSDYG